VLETVHAVVIEDALVAIKRVCSFLARIT